MKHKFIIFLILVLVVFLVSCKNYTTIHKDDANYPAINPTPKGSKVQIELFFPNKNKSTLVKEVRNVNSENEKPETVVINELFKGTKDSSLANIIPDEANMISIHIQNSVIYLNLNKAFINEKIDEKEEALIIYSIVNSLTSLENIHKVQILIQGKRTDKFNKYKLNEPIGFSNIIIDNPYVSPIYVVKEHYNSIINGNYRRIYEMEYSHMKNDISYSQFKLYYKTAFVGLESFQITNYEITNYERDIMLIFDIDLHFADGSIQRQKNKKVHLKYNEDEGRFVIRTGLENDI
ncbi:Sporulation and spore germination [Proteiniborus ethanoligenes]|uniref:Sporulation and spore germination n=1 Tax=Proteiniborus ethanoligenes TaxID=415015 RepID=A0A1H3RTM6_9FIRM|nr:GerMN domain-containing protein [Proteiniborus ethanoligenes]SDZ29056.1 Sporulation and spore germination [Proteiniborus ethanoligenes]